MQTQHKLTPEEELRCLYELYGAGDHATGYTTSVLEYLFQI